MAVPVGSISAPRNGCFTRVFLLAFFGIFLVVGMGLFYFLSIRPIWSLLSAQGWSEESCVVVESHVEASSDGDTFKPVITYTYVYGGMEFTSSRYSFSQWSSSGRSGKEEVVAQYPPGRKFTCYVDPHSPGSAVINRSFSWMLLFGLFSLPFLLIGGVGVLSAVNRGRAQPISQPRSLTSAKVQQFSGKSKNFPSARDIHPPFIVKSGSPFLGLVGSILIAAFWNGIVSFFVVPMFMNGGKDWSWFVAIFMIPFILVGIGFIVLVLRNFLQLFNPRVFLRVTPGAIAIGGRAQVSWQFKSRSERINQVTVKLIGEEKATYRRGTDTTTATNRFFEREIITVTNSTQIASGTAAFEIPKETMHSLTASHNSIRWFVHLQGFIPNWPDVDETMDISVIAAVTNF